MVFKNIVYLCNIANSTVGRHRGELSAIYRTIKQFVTIYNHEISNRYEYKENKTIIHSLRLRFEHDRR